MAKSDLSRLIEKLYKGLYILVVAGFSCLMLGVTTWMVCTNDFYAKTHAYPLVFQDFIRFYSIGQILLSSERDHVYDPTVQLRFFNALIAPAHTSDVMFVQHPPYLFAFFAPFALLPTNYSYFLWFAISIFIGTIGVLLLLASREHKLSSLQIAMFLLGTSATLPAWRAHFIGQLSWHLLGILSLYVWAIQSKRGIVAGIFLALSTIKVQYLPLMALIAVPAQPRKVFLSFICTMLGLLLGAGIILGWSNIFNYPHILLGTESSQDVGLFPEQMVCLRGILSNFLPRALSLNCSLVIYMAATCMLAYCWLRDKRNLVPGSRQYCWLVSITVIVALLLAPHVHHYDCLLLAIPGALTIVTVDPFQATKILDKRLRLWSLIFIFYPLLGWPMMCIPNHLGLWFFTITNVLLFYLAVKIFTKPNSS